MVRERPLVEASQRSLTQEDLEALDIAIKRYKAGGPRIEDFPSRPAEDREGDQHEVERLRKEFARRTSRDSAASERIGAALEMTVAEFGKLWFPGTIAKTSEYDDYQNGTDLVLEMEDENDDKLRVGIDVTVRAEKAREKIADIMRNLYQGLLTQLKYFKSTIDESTDVKFVPRVVIGADQRDQLDHLLRLYLSYQRNDDEAHRAAVEHAITEHPLAREFKGQMLLQLTQSMKALAKSPANADRQGKMDKLQRTVAKLKSAWKNDTALARSSIDAQGRNGVFTVITKFWATA